VRRWKEKEKPQGKWNKLNSVEKIEGMSPVNKILQESIFLCLLAVKSGEDFRERRSGLYEKGMMRSKEGR
jgi:hypothetical protein